MQLNIAILSSTIRICAYWLYPATTLLHRKRNIAIFFSMSIVLMIMLRPILQLVVQPFISFANGSEAVLNSAGSEIKNLERAVFGVVDLEDIVQNYRQAYPKHFDEIIDLIRQSDFDNINRDPSQSVLNGRGSSIWALKRIISKYEQWHNNEGSTASETIEKLRERLDAKDKKYKDGTSTMPINDLFLAFLKEQEGPAENSVTYRLGGHDAAAFKIDPATGEVRLREQLNYEQKNRYEFEVIAEKAQWDNKLIIKKELIVQDAKYSPIRVERDYKQLDTIRETDSLGTVIYKPATLSSGRTRPDSQFRGFFNRLSLPVHWLLLIAGAFLPFVIAVMKWHDGTIRDIFIPYFLLMLSESIALVIAETIDINSTPGVPSASTLLIGIAYTLARILQLSGFLIYNRQYMVRRWLRNFLICLVALWSLNFIGLLNQPFIY